MFCFGPSELCGCIAALRRQASGRPSVSTTRVLFRACWHTASRERLTLYGEHRLDKDSKFLTVYPC